MSQPGGPLWLLGWELTLLWRRWWAVRKDALASRIVTGVVLLALSAAVAWPISRLAPHPPLTPTAIVLAGAAFALIGTLTLSGAIMSTVDVIYARNDLDLLLASPIRPWTLLLVRTSAIALSAALIVLILVSVPAVLLVLFGAPEWFAIVPAVGGLAFFATGVALLLVIALFRLIGPRRTRVAAQVVGALMGATLFLASQAYQFTGSRDDAALGRLIVELLVRGDVVDTGGPLWIPARAALADWKALAIWLAFSLGFYLLAAWAFSANFVNDAAAATGASRRRRQARAGARAFRGGFSGAMIRKELRLLARDPLLISRIGMELVYFLPLGFLLWQRSGRNGQMIGGTLAGVVTMLAGLLAAGFTWITVSAEDAPDLIAAAPVSREDVDHAKLVAASIPVSVLLLPLLGVVAVGSPLDALWLAAGAGAATISACLIGVWYQKPASRSDFSRRRGGGSFLSGLGQHFITLGWTGAAGLAVAGWATLAIVPAAVALGVLLAMGQARPSTA